MRTPRFERPRRLARLLAESALVGSIATFHVADHLVLPDEHQVLAHIAVGLSAPAAASVLGATAADLGLQQSELARGLRFGLAHGAINAAVIASVTALASTRVPALERVLDDPRATADSARESILRATVEIPLGTAVYEELVFRSALLGLAERRWSRPQAVAYTSILFGFWHVLPALEDRRHNPVAQELHSVLTIAPTVAVTAIAGALFARLRHRSGHVIAPIIAHATFNASTYLAANALQRRRSASDANRATTAGTTPSPLATTR